MTDLGSRRPSFETTSILTQKQGTQIVLVVLVLVLETDRLRSIEDEHEDEDEMANEFVVNDIALIWHGFFS